MPSLMRPKRPMKRPPKMMKGRSLEAKLVTGMRAARKRRGP